MQVRISLIVFASLAAACLGVAASAQTAQSAQPTSTEIAQRSVQRYTALLSLSSQQQSQALSIFSAAADSAQPLRMKERALQVALKTAVTSNNTSSIAESSLALGELDGELTSLHALSEAQLYQLLDAGQQARFAAAELDRGHGGPGGPPAGPGAGFAQ